MFRKKRISGVKKSLLFIFLGLLVAGLSFLGYQGLVPEPRDETISIYFTRAGEQEIAVFPVFRTIPPPGTVGERVEAALNLLLQGPTEEERTDGYSHELPEETILRGVRVTRDGIAFLDFSREVESGGGTATMFARLKQVVYTATQFPQVKEVRILIDGKDIPYFSGEGLTVVEKPISREDLEW